MRWSRPADAERLANLIGLAYRSGPEAPSNIWDAAFVRLLMPGDHPMLAADDFALVQDVHTEQIVACACLWQQTWDFGGVHVPIGRAEMVASHPDHRRHPAKATFALYC